VDLLGSILSPEKKAKAAAAAPDTVDQGLPSPSAHIVQGCRNLGISAKLAAIEAIGRVSPSSPWIDY
jgi:hypothetical protein